MRKGIILRMNGDRRGMLRKMRKRKRFLEKMGILKEIIIQSQRKVNYFFIFPGREDGKKRNREKTKLNKFKGRKRNRMISGIFEKRQLASARMKKMRMKNKD